MAGKKTVGNKAANTTEKAAIPSSTEATSQQPTPQVTEEAKDKLLFADDSGYLDEVKGKFPKNPFELRIKNNGRRRLLQFCGVFLESGKTTTVTLKNQLEVDHVKDTLRQFNELAGRNDLVVEEGE